MLTRVTVAPVTVHTGKVVDVKVTGRPEDAVALTRNGAAPDGWFERAPKVMVWLANVTVKCCVTEGAAAKPALPA